MLYTINRTKPHGISTGKEKAFDKIKYLFMIKKKIRLGTEGNFPLLKSIYKNPMANIALSDEKLNALPQIRSKARMSTFAISTQHCTEGPSHGSQETKRKRHPDKKWMTLSLFANDMTSYTENLKEYIQKTY